MAFSYECRTSVTGFIFYPTECSFLMQCVISVFSCILLFIALVDILFEDY